MANFSRHVSQKFPAVASWNGSGLPWLVAISLFLEWETLGDRFIGVGGPREGNAITGGSYEFEADPAGGSGFAKQSLLGMVEKVDGRPSTT